MKINERIDRWYLESQGYKEGPAPKRWSCGVEIGMLKGDDAFCLQCMGVGYDSDPATWTPALYQAIEDAELVIRFIEILHEVSDDYTLRFGAFSSFWHMAVTPVQKAEALARAIEEAEG